MKFFLTLILLITSLCANTIELTPKEKLFIQNHPTITLGVGKGWEPAVIVKEDKINGFDADVLKLINNATGANFVLEVGIWKDIQELAKKKKIYGLMDIVKTKDRDRFLNYSDPYSAIEYSIVTNIKNKNLIKSKDDYKNLTFGYEKGHACHINIIKELGLTKTIEFDTLSEIQEKLQDGIVDITPIPNGYNYALSKNGLPQPIKTDFYFKYLDVYIGVLKEYPEAITIINKALKSISKDTISDLRKKWHMQINEDNLKKKLDLTPEEKAYLANKKVLNTHIEPYWIPYSYHANDIPLGYIYEFQKLLANKLGLELNIRKSTYVQSIKELESGEIDIIVEGYNFTLDPNKYIFSNYSSMLYENVIVGNEIIKDLKQLENKRVGIIAGAEELFVSLLPKSTFVPYEDDKKLLLALTTGEIDFALDEYQVSNYFLNRLLNNKYKISYLSNLNSEFAAKFYITSKKENQILMNIINKVITLNDILTLQKKWITQDNTEKNLILTAEEQELIKNNTYNICVRYNHMPLSGVTNNTLTGISGDILSKIQEKINLKYKIIESSSDKEFLQNINENNCDIISSLSQNFDGFKNIQTTDITFTKEHFVAIGNINQFHLDELEEHNDFTFYVLKEVHLELLKEKYPNINIIKLDSEKEIMKRIQSEIKSVYVTLSLLADYIIEEYDIHQYKVINVLEEIEANDAFGINTQKANELLGIFNKIMKTFTQEDFKNIVNEYKIKEYIHVETTYAWLWYVVAILVLVVILFQYRYILTLKNQREKELETQQKEKELYLKLQKGMEIANGGVWEFDVQTMTFTYDENLINIFGYTKAQYTPEEIFQYFTEDEQKEAFELLTHTLENKVGGEWFHSKTINGVKKYVQVKWDVELDNNGEVSKAIGFDIDITEQVLSEQKEKELLNDLLEAQEIGKFGKWKFDSSTGKFTLSKYIKQLHQIDENIEFSTAEETFSSIHPDDQAKSFEVLQRSLTKNDLFEHNYRLVSANNETIYIKATWNTKLNKDRNVTVLSGIIQDITEQVLAQQEKEAQDKIILHQSRLAQLGEMVSMIAHQWRQPLHIISLYGATINKYIEKTYEKDKKLEEMIFELNSQIKFMDETIENFNEFYKPNKQTNIFNLKNAIEHSISIIKGNILLNKISLITHLDENIELNSYEGEFKQIILVLINNSVDAMKKSEKRELTIKLTNENSNTVIIINDTGSGIKEEDKNRIFQPYFSTKSLNGTGLGLYMIKNMLERSFNGTITFTSSPQGTSFKVMLSPSE